MTQPTLPSAPFTWAQARDLGFQRERLNALVDRGQVRRVLYGVYQRADLPDTLENRALAALLVVSRHAVICDRTAAWLHGVDVFDYRELEILPPVDCVVLSGRHRVERPQCDGGERDLAPRDICVSGGLRLTTPLRTALDLGCSLCRWDALAALDMFMRICGVTVEQLLAELPRYRRRRGVVQLRALILLADPRAESPGESWARLVIHDAGLPPAEPQYWVRYHGVPVFRLDLAYPKSRVAVEYDGLDFHDMTEEQREADRARRKWLRDHGWTVIVLTKESFTPEARTHWLGELRRALRLAA